MAACFGSVTAQDIVDAIRDARGIRIDKRQGPARRGRSRASARTWSRSKSPTASLATIKTMVVAA